jgi:hypothetical protein
VHTEQKLQQCLTVLGSVQADVATYKHAHLASIQDAYRQELQQLTDAYEQQVGLPAGKLLPAMRACAHSPVCSGCWTQLLTDGLHNNNTGPRPAGANASARGAAAGSNRQRDKAGI